MTTSSNSGPKGSDGRSGTGGKRGKNGCDAKRIWCDWDKDWGCSLFKRSSNTTLYNGSYCSDGNTPSSLNSGSSTT